MAFGFWLGEVVGGGVAARGGEEVEGGEGGWVVSVWE